MSLPKIRPVVLGDRRDVRASLQFAEQNLVKQKSIMEADLKKRQVELQRNERLLKKSFGNLTKATNSGVVQTSQKDIRGGHSGAAAETNRKLNRDQEALGMGARQRLGRRHSLHSDALTSELSRLGIGPSSPNRTAGRKPRRRGSVDAAMLASKVSGTNSAGVEANKTDENSLTKQSDRSQLVTEEKQKPLMDDNEMLSKIINENSVRDSCRERNAVFVFKYEEDDSKVQIGLPGAGSCFAVNKAQGIQRESDQSQPTNVAGKPKSALSRSRSQRKKLRVKIMSPVQEDNQSAGLAAESDGQMDSGISEESENSSSCGTRSLYSDSYDSLSHASESDWDQEELPTSPKKKLSIDVNSNQLLKPLKTNRSASEKTQQFDVIDTPEIRASGVGPAQIPQETLGPAKASLTRRRRSIAAAEGISLYRQDKTHLTKRYSDTALLGDPESSQLGPQPSYFPRRRGSTSILGEPLAPDVLNGRQEGLCQPVGTKVKAHHKPAPESNHYVQKTIERAAEWEAVRRTRYLPGYEPNAH